MLPRDNVTLYCGDCLDILPTLAAGSVDAVITDLPYFEIVNQEWDKQWKNRDEYLDWIMQVAREWKRITKDNSSIFLFCDEKMESYIQVKLDDLFLLLNKIVWFKRNNRPQMNAHLLRSFAPMTERALFYMNNFVPLREYFRQYQEALGLGIKQINEKLGHRKAEHAFYWNSTQWDLPTPEVYAELGKLNSNHGFLRREYEDLRRPFNADAKTWDVLDYPIVGGDENTEHPTTKPLGLMRRIVSVITENGQEVLDCCMGSGTTGVAAVQLGRRFIGIEIDPTYFAIAEKRIKQAQQQMLLPLETSSVTA